MTPYVGHIASTRKPARVTIGSTASVQPTPTLRIRWVVMKSCVRSVASWASASNWAKLATSWLKVSDSFRMMFAWVK